MQSVDLPDHPFDGVDTAGVGHGMNFPAVGLLIGYAASKT